MNLKSQNILFLTRTMDTGGTETVILQLCDLFRSKVNKIVVCSAGGKMTKKLAEIGIRHYTIPDIADHSLRTMLEIAGSIRKIITNERITVVHSHHRMAVMYMQLLHHFKPFIPIATAHNVFIDKYHFMRIAYHKVHTIACGGKVYRNLTEYYHLDTGYVTEIDNGMKQDRSLIRPLLEVQQNRKKGNFILGFFGRLSREKGISELIEAMALVVKTHQNTTLLIVGEGEEEKSLRELTERLHLQEQVFFLGYRQDVGNIMRQIDLCVLSSWIEGLPLTLIEAFAAGKCAVSTDIEGSNEIVKDGYNGRLVPVHCPAKFAEGILDIIDNPTKRKKYEENARLTYKTKFSFERFSENYLNYYNSL